MALHPPEIRLASEATRVREAQLAAADPAARAEQAVLVERAEASETPSNHVNRLTTELDIF